MLSTSILISDKFQSMPRSCMIPACFSLLRMAKTPIMKVACLLVNNAAISSMELMHRGVCRGFYICLKAPFCFQNGVRWAKDNKFGLKHVCLNPRLGSLASGLVPLVFGRKACFQLQLEMLLGACQGLAYRIPFPKSESLNVWDPHPHVLLKSLLLNMS